MRGGRLWRGGRLCSLGLAASVPIPKFAYARRSLDANFGFAALAVGFIARPGLAALGSSDRPLRLLAFGLPRRFLFCWHCRSRLCCALALGGSPAWRRRHPVASGPRRARIQKSHGLLERDALRRDVRRQRGIDSVVAHIGPVAAAFDDDGPAFVRVLAERTARIGAEAALARSLRAFFFDQRHGAVEPDREYVVAGRERAVGFAMLHIRTEAADAGNDGRAVSRMLADLARQREQPKRAVEIDVVRIDPLRQAGPFRLFTVDPFAELQVRPETAGTQRNVEPARRILAELLHAAVGSAVRTVPGHELARIAAFRIVAAADKA